MKETLTSKSDQVRELKANDIKNMRSAKEVLPKKTFEAIGASKSAQENFNDREIESRCYRLF